MKSYRPSPSSVRHDMNSYAVKQGARSKLGKRLHQVARQEVVGQKESQYNSSRMLKRSSPYSSTVLEANTGNTHKAVEVETKRRRVGPITFHMKVDDVAYVGDNLGEKYAHHSFYNRLKGYSDLEREKVDIVGNEHDLAGCSEQNDSDNDALSVGSCSINNGWIEKFYNCSFAVPRQARDLDSSDAESANCSLDEEENYSHGLGENVEVSIHVLELQAYRCTLEALYASGPLSWEKELLLTNLRIMLHISNDEHLSELRNLIVR
ncbi:OLC1v1026279C3 [Oldenlandia corymbosa var. corymbosa]|nr:OLC1v1026279C3 [Oldenlandia corymbosa var. corymbosa]